MNNRQRVARVAAVAMLLVGSLVIQGGTAVQAAPYASLVSGRTATVPAPAGRVGMSCLLATSDNRQSMNSGNLGAFTLRVKCATSAPFQNWTDLDPLEVRSQTETITFWELSGSCALNNQCGDNSIKIDCPLIQAARLDNGSDPYYGELQISVNTCTIDLGSGTLDFDRTMIESNLTSTATVKIHNPNAFQSDVYVCGYKGTTGAFNSRTGRCDQSLWADWAGNTPQYHWEDEIIGVPDLCMDYSVSWDPEDSTELRTTERQWITIEAPYPQWNDVYIWFSWDWGWDPLDPWHTVPTEYISPQVVQRSDTTLVLRTPPVTVPVSNYAAHIKCRPVTYGSSAIYSPEDVYYRRLNGNDAPDTPGPDMPRPCWYLRATMAGSWAVDWDETRRLTLWVNQEDFEDTAGIDDLVYLWRPTGGSWATYDLDFDDPGDGPPWTERFSVQTTVDVSGAPGPSTGHSMLRCDDVAGSVFINFAAGGTGDAGGPGGAGGDYGHGGVDGVGDEIGEGGNPAPVGGGPDGGGSSPGGDGGGDGDGSGVGTGEGSVGEGEGSGEGCFSGFGSGGFWSTLLGTVQVWEWIPAGIQAAGCYARALVVPSRSKLVARWESLNVAVDGNVPFSWVAGGLDLLWTMTDGLGADIESKRGTCWTMLPASEEYATEGVQVCPAEYVDEIDSWTSLRQFSGLLVWCLWGLACMQSAMKLWGMHGVETFYMGGVENPGARWTA